HTDYSMKIWSLERLIKTLNLSGIWTLVVHKINDRYKIVLGYSDGTIRFWDTWDEKLDSKIYPCCEEETDDPDASYHVNSIKFINDGRFLVSYASGYRDGMLYLWHVGVSEPIFKLNIKTTVYDSLIALIPDGYIVTGYERD